MQYVISGTVMQTLALDLAQGEVVYSQTNSMCWMNDAIEMNTNTGGGMLAGISRMFSGGTLFVTDFTARGDGHVAFAPRFPDPAANPYLGFAAMLMAGLDGIQNRIHPGEPMDKNLYDLPPEELKDVPTVCGSLREALGELQADHAFLTKGDVFSMDFIESYVELRWEEVYAMEHTPHPIEFLMYYSV